MKSRERISQWKLATGVPYYHHAFRKNIKEYEANYDYMHCPRSWILLLRFFATLRDKGGVKWMRKIRAMDLKLKKGKQEGKARRCMRVRANHWWLSGKAYHLHRDDLGSILVLWLDYHSLASEAIAKMESTYIKSLSRTASAVRPTFSYLEL